MDIKSQVRFLYNYLSDMQTGAYDCGVFAIAYATDIAYSLDPVCLDKRRHLYYISV